MIELKLTPREALNQMSEDDQAYYAEQGLRRTLATHEVPPISLNLPRGITEDMLLHPRSTVLP